MMDGFTVSRDLTRLRDLKRSVSLPFMDSEFSKRYYEFGGRYVWMIGTATSGNTSVVDR